MATMEELVSLVHRAQAGDAEAFQVIVERFQDMAYGYAYAILGDFPLAEDAAQEAFIETYRALPELREAAAFPAWFKRIVFKHCDRRTRRHTPPMLVRGARGRATEDPSPADVAERNRCEIDWSMR
jgi:DNA-directed RNA polymerase specialized sigma24 family protein